MKDSDLEKNLARLMLGGVALAALVMLAGCVWYAAAHPGTRPADHLFTGEPKYLTNPIAMCVNAFRDGAAGERRSVLMIGVVLLLLNPVVRVAFAAAGFAGQRDRLYAMISALVLAILCVSFFW
jgi:uncharacterized membrane protein